MSAFLEIPMSSSPRLVNCGQGEHGSRGTEEWELPGLWCLHIYFYNVELVMGGQAFAVVPGAVTLAAPGTKLVYNYTAKRHRHFYVHFAMEGKSLITRVPAFQHLPEARDEILDRLQNMQRVLTYNRTHAEILFWALLWDIVETGQRHESDADRGVSQVNAIEAFIEETLPGRIMISDIADHLELSATHVNRIVKSRLGLTTNQLIRKRRLQRACRLLLHSTMPVKLIASECGVEDLQQFNKLMRAEYGKSPRHLREHGIEHDDPTWVINRE